MHTVETQYAHGVFVSGNYAYVSDRDFGLKIIDISDPLSAFLVTSVDDLDRTEAVHVSDGIAYLAGGTLQIIDLW